MTHKITVVQLSVTIQNSVKVGAIIVIIAIIESLSGVITFNHNNYKDPRLFCFSKLTYWSY